MSATDNSKMTESDEKLQEQVNTAHQARIDEEQADTERQARLNKYAHDASTGYRPPEDCFAPTRVRQQSRGQGVTTPRRLWT